MIHKLYAIAIVFNGLFLISQVSVAESSQPEWVEGGAKLYPAQLYITATGTAPDVELAKNRALANLSKVFESHIRATSTTQNNVEVVMEQGEKQYSRRQSIAQQIQLRTDKIINGVRIAETWQDKSVSIFHALAVLNRTQASNNIYQEMQQLDYETQVALEQSQLLSDSLRSISALNQSIVYQSKRRALHKMLKVVDIQGKGYPSKWSIRELEAQLEAKLFTLGVAAAVDNDPVGALEETLRSAMGNAGFPADKENPAYTLVVNLDVQDLGFRQGWYWLRAKLAIKVISSDGRVRGRKQWPLKVSALHRMDTEGRLMTQVDETLNAELKQAILQIATAEE
ncbi:hypothetical protein MNBD_GAMMA11-2510 [hydrothermal vent metagenome]|uniref:Lipoprotein LPP20-like domain-containing protein n=1 Tax=hydrothermal vent metagenome TaxID=652676 RepID=A0A3B0XQD8_9ZZZZ